MPLIQGNLRHTQGIIDPHIRHRFVIRESCRLKGGLKLNNETDMDRYALRIAIAIVWIPHKYSLYL